MQSKKNDGEVNESPARKEYLKSGHIIHSFILFYFICTLPACSSYYNNSYKPEGDQKNLIPDAEKTPGPEVSLRAAPPSPPMVDLKCRDGEKYSPDGFQWASWEVCIDYHNPQKLSATYKILDQQYKWGGAWYRWKGDQSGLKDASVMIQITKLPTSWVRSQAITDINGTQFSTNFSTLTPIETTYRANFNIILPMHWGGAGSSGVSCGIDCSVEYDTGQDYQNQKKKLDNLINSTAKDSIIRFGEGFSLPLKYEGSNDIYALMNTDAYLVVMPSINKRTIPFLFGDTHKGIASRCEINPNAITSDHTEQDAEVINARDAYLWLNAPRVWFNVNYFDIREQRKGIKWTKSLCSTPLGMYFDNNLHGPTQGTHNSTSHPFFAGLTSFIDANGNTSTVDTAFISKQSGVESWMRVILNSTTKSSEAVTEAERLLKNNQIFLAISGVSLLGKSSASSSPDAPSTDTTRIAIGYDQSRQVFFILMGGPYRGGFRREDLAAAFRSLGVSNALELDGGGSAALGIDTTRVKVIGSLTLPDTSCLDVPSHIWCSPITQPSGSARPVPGWIGFP